MKKGIIFLLFMLGILSAKAQTIDDYISSNAYHAQYLMQKYGLPASIILGVAIHESADRKSVV